MALLSRQGIDIASGILQRNLDHATTGTIISAVNWLQSTLLGTAPRQWRLSQWPNLIGPGRPFGQRTLPDNEAALTPLAFPPSRR